MELYDVMRTTFAAREFTDDPLPDTTLFKILENARFAPSGGNRQGWYVIIVRDRATREALAALTAPAARRYVAQQQAGESPWNSINPTQVDETTMARTSAPARLTEPVLRAAVVLVVCVDLQVVASTDQDLDRVGVISGASIYPFAWNILLAARHEGYGGTLTTLAVAVLAIFAQRVSAPVASGILMIAGFGLGPIFPCTTVAAQNAVERQHLGIVSGAVTFARALGGAVGVAAASALVLGLAAAALTHIGPVASLEDLTQHTLPPEARAVVARAFGYMFGAVALGLALGLAIFSRVEDRELDDRTPAATTPAVD